MIKKLCKCIREYKKETILTPIFVALEVVFEILITYNMAKLIDKGVEVGNTEMIIKIGLILSTVPNAAVVAEIRPPFCKNSNVSTAI